MPSDERRMLEVIFGRSITEDNPDLGGGAQAVEGRVLGTSSAGMTFTIPSWDGGKHSFGPAPWGASGYVRPSGDDGVSGPRTGDRCLVLFPAGGGDVDDVEPWVIGWWAANG